MVNQQLLEYFKKGISQGNTIEGLRAFYLQNNVPEQDIQEVISHLVKDKNAKPKRILAVLVIITSFVVLVLVLCYFLFLKDYSKAGSFNFRLLSEEELNKRGSFTIPEYAATYEHHIKYTGTDEEIANLIDYYYENKNSITIYHKNNNYTIITNNKDSETIRIEYLVGEDYYLCQTGNETECFRSSNKNIFLLMLLELADKFNNNISQYHILSSRTKNFLGVPGGCYEFQQNNDYSSETFELCHELHGVPVYYKINKPDLVNEMVVKELTRTVNGFDFENDLAIRIKQAQNPQNIVADTPTEGNCRSDCTKGDGIAYLECSGVNECLTVDPKCDREKVNLVIHEPFCHLYGPYDELVESYQCSFIDGQIYVRREETALCYYGCEEGSCIQPQNACADEYGKILPIQTRYCEDEKGNYSFTGCSGDTDIFYWFCDNEQDCRSLGNTCSSNFCKDAVCWMPIQCSDSDEGLDYAEKGEIIIKYANGEDTRVDKCYRESYPNPNWQDSKLLMEWYCVDNKVQYKRYECPNDCVNGACIS
ncbi:hypothetical protein JW930_04345 [Candidatus Woesearchaeota archaeon]|nr:hypothetical protein [Candidatus Woesearchaeota archaeon]